MEIIIGKTAGFCYGVKRAVEGTMKEIEKSQENVYCLGELVHNGEVIKKLESRGLKIVENLENADKKVIIRAHGIPKDIQDNARKLKIELIDFTCPKVLKIHEIANEYSQNGYYIFLTGTKTHPENVGTISYCGNNFFVIESEDEVMKALEEFGKSNQKRLLLISQTTYSLEKFEKIEYLIKEKLSKDVDLIVKNTICMATKLRQKETDEISKKVDFMIIIGGRNSSNTKKLFEIAKKNCDNTICIENEKEINLNKLVENSRIGIMAGASTPNESIKNVIDVLKSMY